jgi:Ca-activated chloride channel homolog
MQFTRKEYEMKNPNRSQNSRRIVAGVVIATVLVSTAVLICGCTKGLDKTSLYSSPAHVGRALFANTSPRASDAFPGSFPSLDEEVWVIARSRAEPTGNDDRPGSGSMWTKIEKQEVAVPLKHTDVKASIDGFIATVKVVQQFHNPYDTKIEAVYVFPLPDNAAVNEFVMTLGERRIRGIIRERNEAEEIYREAKSQGYVASLLTQERPNIFTQSVANIEPGREIDVTIKYFHTLVCSDGWFEFVFPMVVGPRFNPAGSRSGVGAIGRGRQGLSGQRTEVSYLRPSERSGHDISLQVELRPGMEIEETACRTHEVAVARRTPLHTTVDLGSGDAIPNKDFVLRYRLAGDHIKSSLLTHHDERGGFFTLMLVPPRELRSLSRQALELIFVLDSSGSMNGRPLEQAKAAIARGLERLEPDDSFQIIDFSDRASKFGPAPLQATAHNVARGQRYLERVRSSGGTMMLNGIRAALDFPHDPNRLRFVCFLTDGYIGNESEILGEIHRRLEDSRIFSFGVGSSPNRYLLNNMAKLGRGAVAHLGHNDDAGRVMDEFFERISHPALTDLKIDWGDLEATEVLPRRIPDLFVGRPIVLTGRFEGTGRRTVRVTGKANANRVELTLPVDFATETETCEAFPSVWARMKIAELADQAAYGWKPFLPRQIKQLALDYNLMSAYTAFIAVDSSVRTAGTSGTTVPVPVPVPEGVNYKTTVTE